MRQHSFYTFYRVYEQSRPIVSGNVGAFPVDPRAREPVHENKFALKSLLIQKSCDIRKIMDVLKISSEEIWVQKAAKFGHTLVSHPVCIESSTRYCDV